MKNVLYGVKCIFVNVVMGFIFSGFYEGMIVLDYVIVVNKGARKYFGGGDTI